jgi:glutamyl-tRNA reductase
MEHVESIGHFLVAGTNFHKADTQTRGRFALSAEQCQAMLHKAKEHGFRDFIVLSTCNRTEIYACAHLSILKNFLCNGYITHAEYDQYFYFKSGHDALRHLFHVACGMDSQILGDYEIAGQLKRAVEMARACQLVGGLTDRIAGFAFQASKKVKTDTRLSSGKYSVSHAAIELMRAEAQATNFKHVLVLGAGIFGSAVSHAIRQAFPAIKLTLSNRTHEKAQELAARVQASVIPFNQIHDSLNEFDVIITTAGLTHYLIEPAHLRANESKLILDLSVPLAVNPKIKDMMGIRLFSLDEVSNFHNNLLRSREMELPGAEKIIASFVERFLEWHRVYYHRHIIFGYKNKIRQLAGVGAFSGIPESPLDQYDKRIERAFFDLIMQIRTEGYAGCKVIDVMGDLVPVD